MKTARATRRVSRVVYENVSSRGKILFLYKNFPWNYDIDKYEIRRGPKENYSIRRRK